MMDEKKRGLVIGYVSTGDLASMDEEAVRCLDVINIAFGHLRDGEIVWKPENPACLARLRELNPALRIVLSVGGWSADGFSQAAMTEESRRRSAQSAADLTERYGLDGIDIDWEYPGMSVAGIASDPEDGEHFVAWLRELREALRAVRDDAMLTIAAGGDTYYTVHTDMRAASEYLDYVQLMTYDLQGGFQTVTGHHSALYPGRRNLFDACVDKCVRVFHEAGVPMEKLVIGSPFYSRKWEGLTGRYGAGLGEAASGTGGYGPDYGTLLRDFVGKNGFTRYWDDEAKAPWLFDGSTFITYEDEESIAAKVDYVKEKGLGGIMFWEYKCDPTKTLIPFIRRRMDEA